MLLGGCQTLGGFTTMSSSKPATVHCWIYRSSRKDELYVYLRAKDGFADLPEGLRTLLGTPTFVMDLELHRDRQLARADVQTVIEGLRSQGYYLQMPPVSELEPESGG